MVTKKVYKNIIEYRNEKGDLHREDGPAREWSDGDKYWYINGQRHREDGPAFEGSNGDKYWLINGKFHREDGPAIEYYYGDKFWYLNGIQYTQDKYQHELVKIKLKRLVNL